MGAWHRAVVLTACIAAFLVADGTAAERLRAWGWPAGVAVAEAAFWLLVVKDAWVRLPAEEYADRLFDAADTLLRESPQTNSGNE
jgi:hypothetical protein